MARLLAGQVTMNGNIHTVETLIRGTPADVRREVREVLDAFAGNPRVIIFHVGRVTDAAVSLAVSPRAVCGGPRVIIFHVGRVTDAAVFLAVSPRAVTRPTI